MKDDFLKCKLKINDLKCNYLLNPLGVETPAPSFSWILNSSERGQFQKSYRIIAASKLEFLNSLEPDLWDTGNIESDRSIQIIYNGKPLKSRQQVYWKVCVQDSNGNESDWSKIATFEMGILNLKEWKAKWVCNPAGGTDINSSIPAPLFRKSVVIKKKVTSARAYICGLGYYELYINGSKIGEEVLSPAFTKYNETVMYNTYDVSEAFHQGKNVIGTILGNGWYNCFTSEVWDYRQAPWRHHPKLIMQVYILFEDSEEIMVTTDKSWKVSGGPILFDGLRNGEFYDARLEKDGWSTSEYDDSTWENVNISRSPGGKLKSFQMTPIKVTGTVKPVSIKEVLPEVWVYDMGQNLSGWAQLKLSGPQGTEVTLKYAEKLNSDGTIDPSNINFFIKSGEFQTDKYILKGEGLETWEPRFTYHGFQYVQVTGFPGVPTLDNLSGRVVHTAFNSQGEFECSNDLLNKIQTCAKWSTLTNYHGIPTDCPQREKNGWTGDALLSAEQVLMNFDPMSAYTKWLMDFKDVQRYNGQLPGVVPTGGWGFNWGSGPAWDSAMILIPWYMYLYCGDSVILENTYDNMKKYVDFMTSMSDSHIVNFGLGDWCPPVGGPDAYKCPAAVTDTGYYFVDAGIVAKIASLLRKEEDAIIYSKLADEIRNEFRRNFLDLETGKVEGNCQTSIACALYQGFINDNEKPGVLKKLEEQIELFDNHIDCGILGAKYLLHTLSELGRTDLAFAIATQTSFPGWGHWIIQGATTLWESWNGDASRNHHMFSDISAWFYKGLAGINPDPENPGFKHIILRPNPVPGLQWVNCHHNSMYGKIKCNWKIEGNKFNIQVTIPVNCSATLYLPKGYVQNFMESVKPFDGANGVKLLKTDQETLLLSLKSGEYDVTVKTLK